ncbi:hypothetical protein [Haloprofundus halobius]|uniref:hypothetical protein n=1 Tax=Haloprofundus halobius TaxID=2876194 RepID=UPI001CC9459E|nr:hypothetical protein [Haloprofundus halobius]
MPKTNQTRVSQGKNGQYKVTIPKAFADSLDLDGRTVEWNLASASKLTMEVVEDDE